MSRDIKFRAWDGKAMTYPQILGFGYEEFAWCHNRKWLYDCMEWDGEEGFIRNPTLMQFTGLKDKNGNDIFEGDILKHPEFDFNVSVNWAENGYWTLSGWDFLRTNPRLGEVIGNIYENPDLINDVTN